MISIKFRAAFEKAKYLISQRSSKEIEVFNSFRSAYYEDFWKRAADEIGADIEVLGDWYILIKKDNKHTFVHTYEVCLDNHLILRIAGNKHIANRFLARKGYPVPQHCIFNIESIEKGINFLNDLNKKVVVKPSGGGGGRGVTMGVDSVRQFEQAAYYAALFGENLIVEEEISGSSYRLLYLGGEFRDAIRRDPPVVKGDGRSTIAQLIINTNKRRLEQKPVTALSALTVNYALKRNLKMQKLGLNKVLKEGEVIIVNSVVNQNSAAENHVVRDEVHPAIVEMGTEIVKYLGIELAGIDIIADTLSEPLRVTGGIINEINTTPGLHHHHLVAETNKKINVGKMVLDYIFNHPPVIR
jgi:cyanophycin synthetase